ncbi:MAG: Tenacibaculum phage PTm1 [Bacteroidota bacterium]|jgi:hypothetical protein
MYICYLVINSPTLNKVIDYKNFFLTDNKSGWKCVEKKLANKHIDIANDINNFIEIHNLPNNITFKNKIWFYINNITSIPLCQNCGKELTFGRSLTEGYGNYCSLLCTNTSEKHKISVLETNKVKFGGNTPFSSEEVRNKAKNTLIELYGVDNAMLMEGSKQKLKDLCLKKHGVEYPAQSLSIKNNNWFDKIKNENNFVSVKTDEIEHFCSSCNKISTISNLLFNYRKRNNINFCTNCQPKYLSSLNSKITDLLDKYNIQYKTNTRKVIKPLEIDILVPDKKIGIELNGLYWHSELFKDSKYHLNKTVQCENKEIELLHIFEDELLMKNEIVNSMILYKLGITQNKIYARKCVIKEISTEMYRIFLNLNHIQGYAHSKIKIGLFFNNNLVAVSGFSGYRRALGRKTVENEYELIRYSTILNTSVIGGFSKLLNYFEKTYNPEKLISYANRRYSKGNLYLVNGFNFVKNTKPNFFYIINNKREDRFKYKKSNLGKIEVSAEKHMQSLSIYKIYDCGSKLYEKQYLTKK